MRYSVIERWNEDMAVPSVRLVDPNDLKNHNILSGSEGVLHYKQSRARSTYSILIPETHALFNYSLLAAKLSYELVAHSTASDNLQSLIVNFANTVITPPRENSGRLNK